MLLAYAACYAIVVALLPLGGHVVWPEAACAIALQAAVGLLLGLGPRLRLPGTRFVAVLGIAAYLASIALLRDAAPATSGYGPLALLPVLWAALRGGRLELGASIAGLTAVYVVPTVVIGSSQYPVGVWRAGALLIVLAVIIGLVVQRLVGRGDQLFKRLAELARTDPLTGLPNRRAWHELLRRESVVAQRTGHTFTVALLDLDAFKPYNDRHGHLAGDRLLVSVTAAWQSTLREADVLARWGGDEFVLLLPECDAGQAQGLLERLRAAFPVATFSAGLAHSSGEIPPETLLTIADDGLYRAKRGRRVAPATLRADADDESAGPQGPRKPEEEARHTGLEVR